jgi:hypothetical protein
MPVKNRVYQNAFMESSRWNNFVHRKDDVIVCTPSKCGTTWTQMICALLIFQKVDFEKPLSDYTPWLDGLLSGTEEEVLETLNRQTHRRFIKTHTPLDGIPYFGDVKYICVGRDPRDAFVSMKNHFANMNREALRIVEKNAGANWQRPKRPPEDLSERFCKWMSSSCRTDPDHDVAGDVLYYVRSFWGFRHLPNILMVHYSDLKVDLAREMKRIAKFLNIDIADKLWPKLIDAATFEQMRNNSDKLAPQVNENVWKDPKEFFSKGINGQWQNLLGDKELSLYHQQMAKHLEPELRIWLEKGRLARKTPPKKTGRS